MSWSQTKMQRGDTKTALALFERGLALATENRERYQEVRALQYIALAHLSAGDPPEAALEMARSARDWARKMPMLVGIIYGLTFQALALSKLGRHDEAITAIDEVVTHLEGARPEGAEHVYRWRADVQTAAGKVPEAKAAAARAAQAVEPKATKLRDRTFSRGRAWEVRPRSLSERRGGREIRVSGAEVRQSRSRREPCPQRPRRACTPDASCRRHDEAYAWNLRARADNGAGGMRDRGSSGVVRAGAHDRW